MHDNIVIRDLTKDEAGLVANFFHNHWRANHIFHRDREVLLWQYCSNPYAGLFSEGLTFKAAFDGNTLIGVFGYIPFVFNRYGLKQYGCHLSAWWVHPDYRQGPLGMRLLHELQFRMPFDACLAGMNTPIAERLYERLGWVVIHNIPRLILPLDENRLFSVLDPSDSETLVITQQRLRARGSSVTLTADQSIRVSELSSFDCLDELGWDAFYWKQFAPSHIGPARETTYLVWRYQQVPIFRYQALIARQGAAICGLLVSRVEQIKDREEKVVRLVDLVADRMAIVPLINALAEQARQQEAVMIDFFYTNPVYRSALDACGFITASDLTGERYWFPFLFQPLDHTRMRLNCSWWVSNMNMQSTAAKHDFFLTKGDYEFDRPN